MYISLIMIACIVDVFEESMFYSFGLFILLMRCDVQDAGSTEEHLRLFAKLKGFEEQEINRRVEFFLRQMKIDKYRKQPTRELSGGTKRKLSVALSMMGVCF
jgi:ABC-type multidrug transport system ATPase subunit